MPKRGTLDSLPIQWEEGEGGAWQERGVGVLEEDWYPNADYGLSQNHLTHVLIQPSVMASN